MSKGTIINTLYPLSSNQMMSMIEDNIKIIPPIKVKAVEVMDTIMVAPKQNSWTMRKDGGFTKVVDVDFITSIPGYTVYKDRECCIKADLSKPLDEKHDGKVGVSTIYVWDCLKKPNSVYLLK